MCSGMINSMINLAIVGLFRVVTGSRPPRVDESVVVATLKEKGRALLFTIIGSRILFSLS